MEHTVFLTSEAHADVDAAFWWYEGRRSGLGFEFNACLDEALQKAARAPLVYVEVDDDIRRVLVRRFPYAVFFVVEDDDATLTVIGVLHTSRDPDSWRERR